MRYIDKKEIEKEVKDLSPDEKNQSIKDSLRKYREALANQLNLDNDAIKKNEKAYRDGLIADKNGSTVFEESVRLKALGVNISLDQDKINSQVALAMASDSLDQSITSVAQDRRNVDAKINEVSQALDSGQINLDQAKQALADIKSQSILPIESKIEVGISVIDALGIPKVDISIGGGSILIGGNNTPEVKEVNNKQLQLQVNGLEAVAKYKELERKIKDYEYEDKKSKGASKSELASIEAEISNLKKEIHRANQEINQISSKITAQGAI